MQRTSRYQSKPHGVRRLRRNANSTHPNPQSSNMSSSLPQPPKLTCSCKVARCSHKDCRRCSRCGCDHDNIPIKVKLSRKRGGVQPQHSAENGVTTRRKRAKITSIGSVSASVTSCNNVLAKVKKQNIVLPCAKKSVALMQKNRSTLCVKIGRRTNRSTADCRSGKAQDGSSLDEDGISASGKSLRVSDLLRFVLGYDRKMIDSMYADIPTNAVRSKPETWKRFRENSAGRKFYSHFRSLGTVFQLYDRILSKVAEVFCGPAASDSLAVWLDCHVPKHFVPTTEAAMNASPKNLALKSKIGDAFAALKRNSVERGLLRAVVNQSLMHKMQQPPAPPVPANNYVTSLPLKNSILKPEQDPFLRRLATQTTGLLSEELLTELHRRSVGRLRRRRSSLSIVQQDAGDRGDEAKDHNVKQLRSGPTLCQQIIDQHPGNGCQQESDPLSKYLSCLSRAISSSALDEGGNAFTNGARSSVPAV